MPNLKNSKQEVYNVDFIYGMGKKDNDFIIIININRIFSEDELSNLHNINKEI